MAKQNKPSLGTSIRQNSSGVLAALMCIVIGLVIGLIALFIINPEHALVDGFWRILQGGFYDFPYGCGKVLTQTAPLIMTGLSVAFAFKTGLFNIGAAGQYTLGAFGALYFAIVLGMVYNYLPYMVLPIYSVLVKIDRRLIEAAQDLGCNGVNVFKRVILPLSVPGIISGFTMVFVPAVSTFYISQKLGSSGTTLIGDVIESQFKTAYNPNLGAALSLILMVMIFICIGVMNRFGDEEEEVVTL